MLNKWKLIVFCKYFSSVQFFSSTVKHKPSALMFCFPLSCSYPHLTKFVFLASEQETIWKTAFSSISAAVVRVSKDGRHIALTMCLNWVQMTSNSGAKVWERFHKSFQDLCQLRSTYFITSVLNKDVFSHPHHHFDEDASEYPQQKLLGEKEHAIGLGVWCVWLIPSHTSSSWRVSVMGTLFFPPLYCWMFQLYPTIME